MVHVCFIIDIHGKGLHHSSKCTRWTVGDSTDSVTQSRARREQRLKMDGQQILLGNVEDVACGG